MLGLQQGYIRPEETKESRSSFCCGEISVEVAIWHEGCACSSNHFLDEFTVQAEGETIVAKLTHSEYVPWLNRRHQFRDAEVCHTRKGVQKAAVS